MFSRSKLEIGKISGFTLIELMVTLVIATTLITLAVATYTSQIRKSRRTEAKTTLLDLAGREERLYSVTNRYSSTPSDLGYGAAGAVFPMNVGSGYYQVDVAVNAGGTTFRITATPVTADQLKDTRCAQFQIDQTGQQTATNADCWK